MRHNLSTMLIVLAVAGLAVAVSAQQGTPPPNVRVDIVPPEQASFDGAVLYTAYCAVCHGPDLKGFGAAWRHTTTPPTDLTVCAAAHRTVQDREKHVADGIRSAHGQLAAGHGLNGDRLEMPDWVAIFRSLPPRNDVAVRQRVDALARYVVSQEQGIR
jgi:mono/diheme cytochrome c family protein